MPTKHQSMKRSKEIHAKALLEQGVPWRAIAKECGISTKTVCKYSKELKEHLDPEVQHHKEMLDARLLRQSNAAMAAITPEKLDKSSAVQLATVAGIFLDKFHKAQNGGADANINVQIQQVFSAPDKLVDGEVYDE